jgi:hypothetical protein
VEAGTCSGDDVEGSIGSSLSPLTPYSPLVYKDALLYFFVTCTLKDITMTESNLIEGHIT